jgi:hypothetical protein
MKKIILLVILVLMSFGLCNGESPKQDRIMVFLTEYINGKITGRVLQLEISVMDAGKNPIWTLNEIEINYDESNGTTFMHSNIENNKDRIKLPWMKDIKWTPGKSLSCFFLPDGTNYIEFNATKKPNDEFGWDIKCLGKIRIRGAVVENQKWEWKSSKEVELKSKKLKILELR